MSTKIPQIQDDSQILESPSQRRKNYIQSNHNIIKQYHGQPNPNKPHYVYLLIIITQSFFILYLYNSNLQQHKLSDQTIRNILESPDVLRKFQNQQQQNIAVTSFQQKKPQKTQQQVGKQKAINQQKMQKTFLKIKQQKNPQKINLSLQNIQKDSLKELQSNQQNIQLPNSKPNKKYLPLLQQNSNNYKNISLLKITSQNLNPSLLNSAQVKSSKLKLANQTSQNIKLIQKLTSLSPAQQRQKIAQKQSQSSGIGNVGLGTVSELKYGLKNSAGKRIQQVLYDKKTQLQRKKFQQQRVKFLQGQQKFQSVYLASYNNKLNDDRNHQQQKDQSEEYNRINKIWDFNNYTKELPMCLIVPGYNNNARFRIQYNLNSIFQQNYTNYFVVIINDASTDNSHFIYSNYLNFYNISKQKYVYIENTNRKTALQNIYIASKHYCSPLSIGFNLDADDELIGKNVLKTFNVAYQKLKAGVVYSNFYRYNQKSPVSIGFTHEYSDLGKKNNAYREMGISISHLRSYKMKLFLKIKDQDFKDQNGKFWTSAYDMVMYFPMMEMSCGRVHKIEGVHYLYNMDTGLNDYIVDKNKQMKIDSTIRKKNRYKCNEEFNKE